MTYVLLLRLIDRAVSRLVRRLGFESKPGAWIAYWSGRIALHQLNYVERVQKLSGWESVEVVNTPPPSSNWGCGYTLTVGSGTNISGLRINGLLVHDA